MISEKQVNLYCCDDVSKIENYSLAITDMENIWHCHHRMEIGKNGEVISVNELKQHGLYYHRPASELIFLTRSEHVMLHTKGDKNNFYWKHHSECTRRKISEANSGKPSPYKGRHHSEESRRKMSEARKGKRNPPISEETRRKISESVKKYWAKRKMAS